MPQGLLTLRICSFSTVYILKNIFMFLAICSSLIMRNHIHPRHLFIFDVPNNVYIGFGEWQINVKLSNPKINLLIIRAIICVCAYICVVALSICIYSHIIFIKILRLHVEIQFSERDLWLLNNWLLLKTYQFLTIVISEICTLS